MARPREFALRNRVLLLRSDNGIGVDIALGGLPFEEEAIRRARMIELEPGAPIRLCTAEDLIVMKAFADRPRDCDDIRGILVRQGTRALDWDYVRRHLEPLCELKEQPEILDRLETLRREVAATEP
jgi:predicted nucleotidyltransferase